MQNEILLIQARLTLLETHINDTPEKRENYLATFQRMVIEMKKSEPEEMKGAAEHFEKFIERQRNYFDNIIEKSQNS